MLLDSTSVSASLSPGSTTTFCGLPTRRYPPSKSRWASRQRLLLKVWKSRRLTSGSVRKSDVERNGCKAVAQVLTISQLDSLLLIWYSLSDDSRAAIWHDQQGEGNWKVLLDSVSVPTFCHFSCSVHKDHPFASSAPSVLQFGRPVPQTEAKIVGGYGDAHKALIAWMTDCYQA